MSRRKKTAQAIPRALSLTFAGRQDNKFYLNVERTFHLYRSLSRRDYFLSLSFRMAGGESAPLPRSGNGGRNGLFLLPGLLSLSSNHLAQVSVARKARHWKKGESQLVMEGDDGKHQSHGESCF
jgi:hypothetical protein